MVRIKYVRMEFAACDAILLTIVALDLMATVYPTVVK